MRIWFDADNGPHVLIMKPLARELERRGHDVLFTARDRTSTCSLLDLYGLPYRRIGKEYGKGMLRKAVGTVRRAVSLAAAMRDWRADVSFGHGSRSLPIASRLLGVPSITMYDYEWVDPRLFAWGCRAILLPSVIDDGRCREAGIPAAKVVRYPGFKEQLYLGDSPLDPDSVAADLGLRNDAIRVLLRPPATNAHYHNPEAEFLLDRILDRLTAHPEVQVVYLARSDDQMAYLVAHGGLEVIRPSRVFDGPSMIAAMDLVIGGGGTMTREAALLGVPAYSFFRGRSGRVDEALVAEGRLVMLASPVDVAERLVVAKREAEVAIPDPAPLVSYIVDTILGVSS